MLAALHLAESRLSRSLRLVWSDPAGAGDGSLSPDGRRLLYSSRRTGSLNLWSVELGGDEAEQLTHGAGDDFEGRWSPDGSGFVFTSTRSGSKEIWLQELGRDDARALTDTVGDSEYPSWSPDARTVVYTGGPWEAREFRLQPVDGGPSRSLTAGRGRAGAASYLPNGRSLICHVYAARTSSLWLLPLHGGSLRQLTGGDNWDYKPTASPSGAWTAFSRCHDGPGEIWIKRLDGRRARPLVTGRGDDRWPVWGSTDDVLLFHRLIERGRGVWVLDAASGRLTNVVASRERPGYATPHPSGRRIAYAAQIGGQEVLRIAELEGGPARTVQTGDAAVAFPQWSPDGRRLAYVGRRLAGERWGIRMIEPGRGEARAVTQPRASFRGLCGPLSWSPDGSRIAFKADTEPFSSCLYLLDVDSGAVTAVTDDAWWDEAPCFTADGSGLLFMSTRGGDWTWGLFELHLATGALAAVAGPDYTEKNYPRPGPGGTVVWSMYDRAGQERIYQRAPSGDVSLIGAAPPGARHPCVMPDGRGVLFTTYDRCVEYWLLEDHGASDRPLATARWGQGTTLPLRRSSPWRAAGRWDGGGSGRPDVSIGMSPVDIRRR